MRLLINIDKHTENYKNTLAGLLKQHDLQGLVTTKTLQMSELLEAAKLKQCEGILLANEETLNNCVNSTRKVTLDKYRGSRLNFSIPAIVCAPLNHLRVVRHGRWLYEKDLAKFRHIKTPVTRLNFTVCKDTELLQACYDKVQDALILSMDIETDAANRITCIGVSALLPNLKTFTFLIPFVTFGEDFWPSERQYAIAIRYMQMLGNMPQAKLFFNGMYDSTILTTYHAEPLNWVLDSMALAHCQYSELPKTLDFVASYHLYDYYFWKDEADESKKKGDIQGYWAYCARDAFNTLRCFLSQISSLPSYALKNYQIKFKMVYPYMYAGFEGCKIDQATLLANRREAVAIANKAEQELKIMAANENFNPSSSKQVAIFLYDILGAKEIKKITKNKKTGKTSSNRTTDEKALNKIAAQHPILNLVARKLLEYREKTKAISTYFDFNQRDGRLLYSIDPFGTDTARAASRASSFRVWNEDKLTAEPLGTQIQNIPDYARNMCVADDGYKLGESDNNKSEARCVAFLSRCKGLKAALADKERDFYKVLGTIFFGLAYEDVSKDLRNKVLKRIVHGRNYLMGADTFIETAGTDQLYEGARLLNYPITTLKAFALYLLNQYNEPFPEIEEWYKEIKLEVLRTHMLTGPTGYTRYFFGDIIQDHKVFRNAVAHAPQSLSVLILDKGVWRIYNQLVLTRNGDFRLKAQRHDSIFYQYKDDKDIEIVKACMKNPVNVHSDLLDIAVDTNTSSVNGHWLELKS